MSPSEGAVHPVLARCPAAAQRWRTPAGRRRHGGLRPGSKASLLGTQGGNVTMKCTATEDFFRMSDDSLELLPPRSRPGTRETPH